MIRLNLQMFAKTASYMRAYRKSKAIQKQALEATKASSNSESGRADQTQQTASSRGSALSRATGRLSLNDISSRETYTLYRVGGEHNEIEKEYGDRTGKQIEIYMQRRRDTDLDKDRKQSVVQRHHNGSRKNVCEQTQA